MGTDTSSCRSDSTSEPSGRRADERDVAQTVSPSERTGVRAPQRLDNWAIRRMSLADLRCWDRVTLELDPGLIVVSGPNGAGKTSLVEAVCYGMVGVSPRTSREADAIRVGRPAFHVELHVDGPHGRQVREMGYQPGLGRRMRVDAIPQRSVGLWRASGSILVFLPEELRAVKGPPAARRRTIDRILEGTDPSFAQTSAAYTAAVTQRNAMLKRIKTQNAGVAGLTPWDHAVADHGAAVSQARAAMIEDLRPRFARWLEELGGGPAGRLEWEPSPGDLAEHEPEAFHAHLAERLASNRSRDIQAAQTLSGPHRDDVWIGAGDQDLRRTGSQGEQRTAVLALLLACRELLSEHAVTPILLLDDVLSELDPRRRRRLLDALVGDGQSWITSADPDAADLAAASGAAHYLRVEDGHVTTTP